MIAATHNGTFHADDCFAYAVLKKVFPLIDLVRTRDMNELEKAEIVFDVGMVFDPKKRRFDHHMANPPLRVDGIPFSAFGQIWNEFGRLYLNKLDTEHDKNLEELFTKIDSSIVRTIDMMDNGFSTESNELYIGELIHNFNPTWDIEITKEKEDSLFLEAAALATTILENKVTQLHAKIKAKKELDKYVISKEDSEILLLDRYIPWRDIISDDEHENILYVIYPSKGSWAAEAVAVNKKTYDLKAPFPKEWAGLRGDDLKSVSGLTTAEFCHRAQFFMIAGSIDDIYKAIDISRSTSNKPMSQNENKR